jgi:hypothetical protein
VIKKQIERLRDSGDHLRDHGAVSSLHKTVPFLLMSPDH